MITATQAPECYLEAFEEFNHHTGHQPSWLHTLREEAFAQFSDAGIPTTHDEDWRFTNLSTLAQTPFTLAGIGSVLEEDLERFATSGFACKLVFVNGRFAPQLSRIPVLAPGVQAGSLAEALAEAPETIGPHLARYINFRRDAFCALNTAFIDDGAYIKVPRGVVVEEPIYLLYVTAPVAGSNAFPMTHPRTLIVAEDGSQVSVVEDYVSLNAGISFSNTVTEFVAGDNAVVSHTMIVREDPQAYNVSTLRIQQTRSTQVATHSVLLGGALVRNNVHPVMAGEGSECLINGLFIGVERQQLDNYMLVEHASPHCSSRQFYNGILSGRSHGVFHGRIIVHKDAQKTDAKQTNRNLLLSDDAQIDTKPQLEIYADDVKCTHGATIGKLEPEALFYARSRGLDEASARHLLLLAFANECLDRMNEGAVRDHVETLIMKALPSALPPAGPPSPDIGRNWEEVG